MIWRAHCLRSRHLRRPGAKPRSARRCDTSMGAERQRPCRQGARCDHGRNWQDWPLLRWFWSWACRLPGSCSIATNFMHHPGSTAAGSTYRLRLLRQTGQQRRRLRLNRFGRRFPRRPLQKLSRRRRPARLCLRPVPSFRATPSRPHRHLPHLRRRRRRHLHRPSPHPLHWSPVRPPCVRNAGPRRTVDFRSAGRWQRRPPLRRNRRLRRGLGPRPAMQGLRAAGSLPRRAPISSSPERE